MDIIRKIDCIRSAWGSNTAAALWSCCRTDRHVRDGEIEKITDTNWPGVCTLHTLHYRGLIYRFLEQKPRNKREAFYQLQKLLRHWNCHCLITVVIVVVAVVVLPIRACLLLLHFPSFPWWSLLLAALRHRDGCSPRPRKRRSPSLFTALTPIRSRHAIFLHLFLPPLAAHTMQPARDQDIAD